MPASKPRLRKKCQDCGKRGNWPKTIEIDTCEQCTSVRLMHHGIAKRYYDNCAQRAGNKRASQCDPKSPTVCASCAEYHASASYRFWDTVR